MPQIWYLFKVQKHSDFSCKDWNFNCSLELRLLTPDFPKIKSIEQLLFLENVKTTQNVLIWSLMN